MFELQVHEVRISVLPTPNGMNMVRPKGTPKMPAIKHSLVHLDIEFSSSEPLCSEFRILNKDPSDSHSLLKSYSITTVDG